MATSTPEEGSRPGELHEHIQSGPLFEIVEIGNNQDLKRLADDMTAREYHDSFSPGLSFEDVKRLICEDLYGMPHRAKQLIAFEIDQKTGTKKEFAGAIRVGFGQQVRFDQEEEYPLETAALLVPQGGWRRMTEEVLMEDSMELCRVIVAKRLRGKRTPNVLQALFDVAVTLSPPDSKRPMKRAYITMKEGLYIQSTRAGYVPNGPFPVTLETNPYALRTQSNFDAYWNDRQDPPRLGYFDIPPKMKQPVRNP